MLSSDSKALSKPVEIIKNKLYWISNKEPPKKSSNMFFFNIDNDLVYEPFNSDFGPLDIGKTCKFVLEVEKLLQCSQFANCKICHYTSIEDAKRTNAAFLMAAFQLLILNKSAEEAWRPFKEVEPLFISFRDASTDRNCDYKCTPLDCLKGLEKAIQLKWFNLRTFNIKEYQHYEKVQNGDLNWIIPGKIIAFSGPSATPEDSLGYKRLTPNDYIPIFRRLKTKMIIRLNEKEYDEEKFKKYGIKHKDLYFPDATCPSDDLISEFISTCEEEKGPIAIHCKAGLGRTGTMIACFAMKHYKFPAASFIGWIRLCRPGSILGKQQEFIIKKETHLRELP